MRVRHFFDHLLPIQRIIDWIEPYLDLTDVEKADLDVVRLHRRILRWGMATGIANSLAWLSMILLAFFQEFARTGNADDLLYLLYAPLIMITQFIPGTCVGMPIALALTPKWFLLSPAGDRWIRLIGTKNLTVGRIICVIGGSISSLVIAVPLIAIVVLLVHF